MTLDYIALGILIFVALVLFYGIIALHDIPYDIAKARKHPQQDAIHVAGWVSLFTLHAIWPFLWIWATIYRPDRGWGFATDTEEKPLIPHLQNQMDQLQTKLNYIENEEKIVIPRLQNQMEQLQTKLTTFESEESTVISSLKEQLTQLQNRIESIESKKNKDDA